MIAHSCLKVPPSSPMGDPRPPPRIPMPILTPIGGDSSSAHTSLLLHSLTSIPLSLRLLQLRKKLSSRALRHSGGVLGPASNAVWSLALALESLQFSSSPLEELREKDCVTRDTVVWLFRNVFASSPAFSVDLLLLMSRFLERETSGAPPPKQTKVDFKTWSDLGVIFDFKERPPAYDYRKRRAAYEQLIASGESGSLVLSNYAQLLYQYDRDLNRAEFYFSKAASSEPADGEAMRRYAVFLWEERGDTERAEEMFQEALRIEPESTEFQRSYVWFLLATGGAETCYPLEEDN